MAYIFSGQFLSMAFLSTISYSQFFQVFHFYRQFLVIYFKARFMFQQYILSSSTSTIFTIHHLRRLLLLKYKLIKLPRNQSLVHEQHYVFHLFLEQIILTKKNQSIRSYITTVSWIISQSQSPADLSGSFRISGSRIRRSQPVPAACRVC